MDFGQAVAALKEGKRVAREGWNGKGMFLWLNRGSIAGETLINGVPSSQSEVQNTKVEGIPLTLFQQGDEGTITRLPNINMRAATGSTVTGWLASQTDILGEDWVTLD